MGLSIEQVAQGTGLTVDEVKFLAKWFVKQYFQYLHISYSTIFNPLLNFVTHLDFYKTM